MRKIAIIGGGITGLATAYYLLKAQPECSVTIFEATDRLGGKIKTTVKDGVVIEEGPDAISSRRPELWELVEELGLEDQVIWPNVRGFSILRNGELHFVPPEMLKPYPANLTAIWRSGLFSPLAKLKASILPFFSGRLSKPINFETETVHSFFSRRWGREVSLNLYETLYGRIYGGGPESELALASLPRSAIFATSPDSAKSARGSSPFLSFKLGMEQLVSEITGRITSAEILLNAPIEGLFESGAGFRLKSRGNEWDFDEVIVCTAPHVAARITAGVSQELSAELQSIPIQPSRLISLGFSLDNVPTQMRGSGFLLGLGENSPIKGCTYASLKWSGRAPESFLVVRYFIDADFHAKSEDRLFEAVLKENSRLFGIKEQPQIKVFSYWSEGYPLFDLQQIKRVKRLRTLEQQAGGISLAGCYLDGAGIPDCLAQAKSIARRVLLSGDSEVKEEPADSFSGVEFENRSER